MVSGEMELNYLAQIHLILEAEFGSEKKKKKSGNYNI